MSLHGVLLYGVLQIWRWIGNKISTHLFPRAKLKNSELYIYFSNNLFLIVFKKEISST